MAIKKICDQINKTLGNKLEVIAGLNAKEVKGVIGSSYFCISSRYHGVASALSQGVPCISTSWNHKYEMLFKDYGLEDMVLDLESSEKDQRAKVDKVLEEDKNHLMKTHLLNEKKEFAVRIEKMWSEVFKIISN